MGLLQEVEHNIAVVLRHAQIEEDRAVLLGPEFFEGIDGIARNFDVEVALQQRSDQGAGRLVVINNKDVGFVCFRHSAVRCRDFGFSAFYTLRSCIRTESSSRSGADGVASSPMDASSIVSCRRSWRDGRGARWRSAIA